MWFYSIIFLLLILILSAGYFLDYQRESYWLCVGTLIIIAAFRPENCCQDYAVYVDYYQNISAIPYTFLEPTYALIANFSRLVFNSATGVFVIYAILGVGLKGIAFIRLTKYYSITLILYFSSFFLLHEMTQIRVGVASAILLLSIPSIVGKDLKRFLFYLIAGTLFHYSFIIFGFCYFINAKKINPLMYMAIIGLTFVAVLAGVHLTSILQFINLGFISNKIDSYKALLEEGIHGEIMLINPLLFLRIAILGALLWNWEKLQEYNRHAVVLIKIYAFSIFFFIAFSDLPVLAGRVSQLFGIVEIVLVPFVVYILTPKYYAIAIALAFALLIMYKQLYYSDLLNSYF